MRPVLIVPACVSALALGAALGVLAGPRPPAATAATTATSAVAPGVWYAEMGDFRRLVSAVAFAPDDVWAAGDGIVRFDGTAWRQVLDAARTGTFNAIDGVAPDQLWAAGESGNDACEAVGMLYRHDGTRWLPESPGTHAPLYDIDLRTATDGWAVGGIGTGVVVHYDGRAWRLADSPEVHGLRAVQAVAADDVWAVGDRGAIVHFDGTDWTATEGPDFANLTDVSVLESGVGWAVGFDRKTNGGVTLRFSGGRWTLDSFNELPRLLAVQTLAPDLTLAVGANGVMMHHDGTLWREIGRTYPGGFDPWALAARADAADGGTTAGGETAMGGGTATDGDTAADSGTKAGTGTAADAGTATDGDTAADAGSVRDGQFPPDSRWDTGFLHSLVPLPDNETFLAVGDSGQVVRIDDTLQWRELHSGHQLYAIDMLAPDYGWIVGKGGPPLRWDGQAWTAPPAPPHARWLTSIKVVARDDVWAAGHRGTLMHWDGSAWTEWPAFTWLDLGAIDFSGPDDGWLVTATDWEDLFEGGASGSIYRWDGRTWTLMTRTCGALVTDVVAVGPGEAWFSSMLPYWDPWEDEAESGPMPQRILHHDDRGFTWHPILGETSPGGPAVTVWQLARGRDGSLWGVGGDGIARFSNGAWRTVSREGLWVEAIAGADATGFWGVADDTVVRYAAGRRPEVVNLFNRDFSDLAVLHDAAGVADLWLIGDASTVVRYRAPARDRPFPEATATAVLPAPVLVPTPTPRSVFDEAEATERILALVDPAGTGEYVQSRMMLATAAGFRAFLEREYLNVPWDEEAGYRWTSRGNLEPCARGPEYPVWLAEFSSAPGCASHVFVVLDALEGDAYIYACYPRKVMSAFLPVALQPRVENPDASEPTPTPRPRNLTPEPMPTVQGGCPSPTPAPTDEGEGEGKG